MKKIIAGGIVVLLLVVLISSVNAQTETLFVEDLISDNTINNEANVYGAANGSVATILGCEDGDLIYAIINNHSSSGTITSVTFQIKLKKGEGWADDTVDVQYTNDSINWIEVGADYTPQATLTWTINYTATEVDTWTKVDNMQVRVVGDKIAQPDKGDLDIDAVHVYVSYAAIDTTFTVSLPNGYTKPVFQPPNSTATNYPPNGQNSTQEFYNVTNTGNVNLDVRMKLNATVNTITLKADTDNNPTGASTIGTSLVTLQTGLTQGNSVNIWLWSDFDHTPAQNALKLISINVSQS